MNPNNMEFGLNSELHRFPQSRGRSNPLTGGGVFFRLACSLNGYCFGLDREFCTKVFCALVWLFKALLFFGALPRLVSSQLLSRIEPLTPASLTGIIKKLVCGLAMLRWRLSFILRNEDFESVLQGHGRRFRDFLPIMLYTWLFLVMTIAAFVKKRTGYCCFLFLTLFCIYPLKRPLLCCIVTWQTRGSRHMHLLLFLPDFLSGRERISPGRAHCSI